MCTGLYNKDTAFQGKYCAGFLIAHYEELDFVSLHFFTYGENPLHMQHSLVLLYNTRGKNANVSNKVFVSDS